jgi:hypothetical protein
MVRLRRADAAARGSDIAVAEFLFRANEKPGYGSRLDSPRLSPIRDVDGARPQPGDEFGSPGETASARSASNESTKAHGASAIVIARARVSHPAANAMVCADAGSTAWATFAGDRHRRRDDDHALKNRAASRLSPSVV